MDFVPEMVSVTLVQNQFPVSEDMRFVATIPRGSPWLFGVDDPFIQIELFTTKIRFLLYQRT